MLTTESTHVVTYGISNHKEESLQHGQPLQISPIKHDFIIKAQRRISFARIQSKLTFIDLSTHI